MPKERTLDHHSQPLASTVEDPGSSEKHVSSVTLSLPCSLCPTVMLYVGSMPQDPARRRHCTALPCPSFNQSRRRNESMTPGVCEAVSGLSVVARTAGVLMAMSLASFGNMGGNFRPILWSCAPLHAWSGLHQALLIVIGALSLSCWLSMDRTARIVKSVASVFVDRVPCKTFAILSAMP